MARNHVPYVVVLSLVGVLQVKAAEPHSWAAPLPEAYCPQPVEAGAEVGDLPAEAIPQSPPEDPVETGVEVGDLPAEVPQSDAEGPVDVPERAGSLRSWVPPIGIPAPPFGIEETAPGSPSPWNVTIAGFYYVDNTHPAATDTDNSNGYPSRPRRTIPTNPPLPSGSVVEIHGGPYNYGTDEFIRVLALGTAQNPVFITGVDMPRFDKKLVVFNSADAPITSSYLIIEGLNLYRCEIVAPAHHIALRYCDVHGNAADGGVVVASYTAPRTVSDIVIWGNSIHDNGDWQASFDQDKHGVSVTARVSNCWILENQLFHNSGDGVQINAGQADQASTHHIYVGWNTAYENKQTGFWTKQAVDVIFSENTSFGHYPVGTSPSAWGAGMGYQYGPERVWFLDNHVYDCAFGIQATNTNGLGTGQHSYFVGNVIHDIHHHPGYLYEPTSAWSSAGIMLVGTPSLWIVNNTIYDVDAGIHGPSEGMYYMANNLIANVTEPQANHVLIESGAAIASSRMLNTLFDDQARIRWGSTTVYDLAGLESAFPGAAHGCMAEVPAMIDPDTGDFHLQGESPAINHGTGSAVYSLFQALYGINILRDPDGAARPQGRWMDIGAYEGIAPDIWTDVDGDGDVDLFDWRLLAPCMRGPDIAFPTGCSASDFDEDEDVDLVDFAEFQVDYSPDGGPPEID